MWQLFSPQYFGITSDTVKTLEVWLITTTQQTVEGTNLLPSMRYTVFIFTFKGLLCYKLLEIRERAGTNGFI